ncbi:MAG: ADOP family duplicated permease [Gemmatimonadales bacterium]
MKPPRIPAALFRALLPHAERREVLHDLAAEYRERAAAGGEWRADVWYVRQLLGSLPALLGRTVWRGRTGFEPGASRMRPGGPGLEQWIMDARHAVRRLVRRPRYATLAILTLALGIGGTAAVFGIARTIFFDPLPYTAPASIALFSSPFDWSRQEFAFFRGRVPGFSQVAQYLYNDATLELGNGPSQLVGFSAASSEIFGVLGVRPALGRPFSVNDELQGAAPVAVISYGLYEELGGTPAVIGQTIRFNGASTTVLGVMPRGFYFPTPTVRVWVPAIQHPDDSNGNWALVGRVAPGNNIEHMESSLKAFGVLLKSRFSYTPQWDKVKTLSVQSIRESIAAPLRPSLVAVMVAMGMILLIACANVASLMLGQVEGRTAELAVRAALGASRTRLARQLVAEALVLGVAAGAIGAAFAAGGFRLLVRALPLGAFAETATFDWTVFAAAMTIALVTALVISLVPTASLWRGRLRGSLSASRTQGIAGRGVRLESLLVVAEVSVAVLMTAGAGLIGRSVQKLYAIDPGVHAAGVGVVDVVLPSDLTDDQRRVAYRDMIAAMRSLPGVTSAALTQRVPLRGSAWTSGVRIEGLTDVTRASTFVRIVSAGYFDAMGIKITEGRGFDESDMVPAPGDTSGGPIVITEAFARKFFPGQSALGRHITSGFTNKWARIVGIVGDVHEGNLTDAPTPARYIPYSSMPFTVPGQTLVFRVADGRDPVAMLEPVRAAILKASPRLAVQEATTMNAVLAIAVGPARQVLALVTLLTALALFLGAIGIYGVMSHFVSRRKRDWGIRIALGLSPSRVLGGVVGQATTLVAVGITTGLVAFVLLARFLGALVYGVGRTDPVALGAATVGLLAVGVIATLVPALRASGTDPAVVLREQ